MQKLAMWPCSRMKWPYSKNNWRAASMWDAGEETVSGWITQVPDGFAPLVPAAVVRDARCMDRVYDGLGLLP